MKDERFDVAVIGSGIGGLCAGAIAAKSGYKTLVVEKIPRIGGRYSTIDYKGFKVHMGGIMVELGTELETILRDLGAGEEFDKVRPMTPNFMHIGGKSYQFPTEEEGGLPKLLAITGHEEDAAKLSEPLRRAFTWQEPSSKLSVKEWLLQYTRNQGILDIFNCFSSNFLCITSQEAPAADFFSFAKIAGSAWHGYGCHPEGPIGIPLALAKIIKNKGGEIWTGCPARQIVVDKGRVKGIVIDRDGRETEISAQAVISNVGPSKTVALAGVDSFDKGYLREIRENYAPLPHIWVHTISDRPLLGPGGHTFAGTRRLMNGCDSTHVCPEHAPPGKYLTQTGSLTGTHFGQIDFKKEIELHIEDLKDTFPDFQKHGKVLMASCFRDEWPVIRNVPPACHAMPQKTPIELLYNVGDSLGGSNGMIPGVAAVVSGKRAADDLMNRIVPR